MWGICPYCLKNKQEMKKKGSRIESSSVSGTICSILLWPLMRAAAASCALTEPDLSALRASARLTLTPSLCGRFCHPNLWLQNPKFKSCVTCPSSYSLKVAEQYPQRLDCGPHRNTVSETECSASSGLTSNLKEATFPHELGFYHMLLNP